MKYALAALVFGVAFLYAETTITPPVTASDIKTLDFAPGGTLQIDHSTGNLWVEGWDQAKVQIEIARSAGFAPNAAEKNRLEHVQVLTAAQSASEVTIQTSGKTHLNAFFHPNSNDIAIEYRIRVPRNTNLVIHHERGQVSVLGVSGNVSATNHRGDITLLMPELAQYSIEARTKAGAVTSDLAGDTHQHLLGQRFSRTASTQAHNLNLQMGFGGIEIKELPPEAVAKN